jgi:hypothetical protein
MTGVDFTEFLIQIWHSLIPKHDKILTFTYCKDLQFLFLNFRRLVYRNRPYTSTSMTDKNTHLWTQQRMLNFRHEYSLFERINVLDVY